MRKDWEFYSIKDLGKIVTGSTPSTKNELNYSSNDYSFVKPSDISQSQISYIDETECYVSEYAFQNSRILPSGAVLVTCIGIIGKVGIVVNDCICNQQINAIIPNEKVNNKFLAYSIFSKKEMLALIANAPVVPIINKNDFSNIKLSVPPLQTQQQIVEELDCLTSIIEKQKKQLEELDNLAQSIFYDMFGDPIENEKGWDIKKIKDISLSVNYGTSSPSTDEGKYKYLRMNNITSKGTIDLSSIKYINVPLEDLEKYVVRKGDILFNRTNSKELVGKSALYSFEEDMIIAGYIIRLRVIDSIVLPIFLSSYMNTPCAKEYFRSIAKGAVNQSNINSKQLLSTSVYIPPLSLQQQFASKIESIEKQKVLIKKSIKETEDLFNSRMDYYFN